MSLTYLEAVLTGALQGVTELFPVSSLGHSVILPAVVGGDWARDLDVSAPDSPYLAFVVGLHVATALALLLFFWRDWVRIGRGFLSSVRHRRISTDAEKLAWSIVAATIPVGVAGLLLDHLFRTTLGRPIPAAAFLVVNGLVLLAGERLRRRAPGAADPVAPVPVGAAIAGPGPGDAGDHGVHDGGSDDDRAADRRLAALPRRRAVAIGAAQILALLPGISRSGVTMVAGLAQGLSHRDAARFAFLLATPVIGLAGLLKLPELAGAVRGGLGGPILAGSVAAFVAAYLAVRFLERYFQTRTLVPFAIYSLVAGGAALVWLSIR